MSDTIFAPGFDKAQAQYDGAEPDDEECTCPCDNCDTCDQESPGLWCCGGCMEDDGPDPDRIRDERIDREMDQ